MALPTNPPISKVQSVVRVVPTATPKSVPQARAENPNMLVIHKPGEEKKCRVCGTKVAAQYKYILKLRRYISVPWCPNCKREVV